MGKTVRNTKSVCPICLKTISAQLVQEDDGIYMEKHCAEHGSFRVIVWRNRVSFSDWRGNTPELSADTGFRCPSDCGNCAEHEQGSCCVLLEVTRRCNLNCTYCFADGMQQNPTMDELKHAVDVIAAKGKPLIQLSGGEPTLRDDLPELIEYIRSTGCKYVQLNSNGIRLAEDEAYTHSLATAGLSFVFLQFDGVTEDVYHALRDRPLLETKKKAIEVCGKYGLGVTLVPTLVRGVNEDQVGEIVRFGMSLSPVVRGVHFQPVSYFGRYEKPDTENAVRYTLDELIDALYVQAGIAGENIAQSHCDHPGCGFHAGFMILEDGSPAPLTTRMHSGSCVSAEKNRAYIGSRWRRDTQAEIECSTAYHAKSSVSDAMSLDDFLRRAKTHSFTVTAMAFQDAMNLDIERLRRCSLHVYDEGVLKPFCARYLTAVKED